MMENWGFRERASQPKAKGRRYHTWRWWQEYADGGEIAFSNFSIFRV